MTTDTGSTSADPPATDDAAGEGTTLEKKDDTATSAGTAQPGRADTAVYVRVAASEEFGELRRALRSFVFPMTVAFLLWYLLYVVLSAFARDFMSTIVVGNLNVAFIFGVLQFASTFLIAWWYARYANRKLDPAADRIRAEVESESHPFGEEGAR